MMGQMLPRQKAHGWSHEIKVLVTVYWLACGASYRVTSENFSMPLSTVCRTVHNVVDEMMTILHKIIHFPKAEEMEEVGGGFARLAGHEALRCAAGAIDRCFIRTVPPAEPRKRCYINRKISPAIILQGTCDAKGTYRCVYWQSRLCTRCPCAAQITNVPAGSVSTSRILSLGDGGFPCLQHPVAIMTPYR